MAKKVLTFFVIFAFCWFEISCVTTSPRQRISRGSVAQGLFNPVPETPKDGSDDNAPKTVESLSPEKIDRAGDPPFVASAFDEGLKAFRGSLRAPSHRPFGFSQTGIGAWEPRKPGPLLKVALFVVAAVAVVVIGALLLRKAFNPH